MTSYIHFKFKSAKDFEEISFAGPFIKLVDLKRAVVEAKSLHKGMDFDLSVVDDHSKEGTNTCMTTNIPVWSLPHFSHLESMSNASLSVKTNVASVDQFPIYFSSVLVYQGLWELVRCIHPKLLITTH